jgi:hypothetical protein
MMEEVNGKGVAEIGGPQPDDLPGMSGDEMAKMAAAAAQGGAQVNSIEQARKVLEAQARQVFGLMLRGWMVSTPGLDPIESLKAVSRAMGGLLGDALAGEIIPVSTARRGFKEAFEAGMKASPIRPAPQPQRPPMSAVPRR